MFWAFLKTWKAGFWWCQLLTNLALHSSHLASEVHSWNWMEVGISEVQASIQKEEVATGHVSQAKMWRIYFPILTTDAFVISSDISADKERVVTPKQMFDKWPWTTTMSWNANTRLSQSTFLKMWQIHQCSSDVVSQSDVTCLWLANAESIGQGSNFNQIGPFWIQALDL